MPANPGQKRNQERLKKKRDKAQKERRKELAVKAERKAGEEDRVPTVAHTEGGRVDAAPSPFYSPKGEEIDWDALDALNESFKKQLKSKKLWADAEETAEKIGADYPDQPDGPQRMADLLEARGQLKEAIVALRVAEKRATDLQMDADEILEITKRIDKLSAKAG